MNNKVPFADLTQQYLNLKYEIDSAIQEVINEGAFIGGNSNRFVIELENNFSKYIGSQYGIGCANGTDALEIILDFLKLEKNDEIIVPALSWFSTAEAVLTAGANVSFVDILEDGTIDPSKIEETINSNTKAIIPVHLYGNAARMSEIVAIAEKHNLFVLEDCAQAHGAKHQGRNVGTFGNAASFSFYPGKNLGAYGDAGMILTNDSSIDDYCRKARNHGQTKKHVHHFSSRNSRLDGIQAAIVNTKLPYLNQWNKERLNIAKLYHQLLSKIDFIDVPKIDDEHLQVFHLYVIRTKYRNKLAAHLSDKGIATGIHYPNPLPSLPPFSEKDIENNYPVTNKLCNEILSLPIYPEMKEQQIYEVCEAIKSFKE